MDAIDSAAALLDRLASSGLTVLMVDGTLRIGPPDRLTADLRTSIASHRDSIIALLTSAQPPIRWETDPLACSDTDLAEMIAGMSGHLRLEIDALAEELHRDGRAAISAYRWFATHPAMGTAPVDHLAVLVAVRMATDRGPPGPTPADAR